MNYVFSTKQTKRYQFPTHINDLVMDRSEATSSEVFIVELGPGEAPPLHQHDDTEQDGTSDVFLRGHPADFFRLFPDDFRDIQILHLYFPGKCNGFYYCNVLLNIQ